MAFTPAVDRLLLRVRLGTALAAVSHGAAFGVSFAFRAAAASAFIIITSSLVANLPLILGRTSAYALRLSYLIVFSNVLLLRFSRYLQQEQCISCLQP